MTPAEIVSTAAPATSSHIGIIVMITLAWITTTGGIITAIITTGGKTNKTLNAIHVALASKVEEKDCEHRRDKIDNEVDTRIVRHQERQAQVNDNIYDNLSRLAARVNGNMVAGRVQSTSQTEVM
jgi:3-deoxy-D-arabino-heptulosonate 7-phosphate (DAHP) synthase